MRQTTNLLLSCMKYAIDLLKGAECHLFQFAKKKKKLESFLILIFCCIWLEISTLLSVLVALLQIPSVNRPETASFTNFYPNMS